MTKIFVSHAVKDADLVTPFLDLFQNQFNLVRDNFFNTSDEQLNPGKNWVEEIRESMQDADLIIAIITPNYLDSDFCLCELGAAWVNDANLVPIIIPPLDYRALDSTPYRSVIQVITLDSRDGLTRIFDSFNKRKIGRDPNLTRFLKRAEVFQTDYLEPFIIEMRAKEIVSPALVKQLRTEKESAEQAFAQADDELTRLRTENEYLRKMKDAEEVQAMDDANLNEWETLLKLADEVREAVRPFNRLAQSVLYYSYNDTAFTVSDQYDVNKLDSLKREGRVLWDNGWYIDDEHPDMARVLDQLNKIRDLISNFDYTLEPKFKREYPGDRFGLQFSPFWSIMFGIEIYPLD
ncbi:TIR domain-containing protein [Paenibacillus sp. 1A_MP2]|uniref:TIR domain-containing protein n=1 Tax=Paenibacillus sp. 1A_MP2 TaxID=3457495 RepID=UPI003FCC7927